MYSRVPSPIPSDDSSRAGSGTPRALTRPNSAGAWPARARLNISREVMYSWLFIADNAAIRITALNTAPA
ncbi:hypothetical protein D3C72_2026840 [compost metagenome]